MNPFRIPSDFVAKNFFVLRFVMSGWLIGFYIKLIFYGPYLWRIVPEYPMRYNHFPEFLMNASVAQIFYLLPLISLFFIGSQRQDRLLFCSAMMTLSSFILFLHIDTYNDMTFLTTFWSGLWMIWFASQANRTDQNFRLHACVLAQCLVGIIFLGGTVGKLTSGYWNGTVFYNIFFIQKPHWPLTYIEALPTVEAQKNAFLIFSRLIIIVEAFLATAPFLPTRFISIVGPFLIAGITVFCSWPILSVIFILMVLLWACLLLEKT